MAEIPLIFISYSHDSSEHKEWVRTLAEKLSAHGVEVLLDQWEDAGIDLGRFMERGVKTSRFVLLICTDIFVKKVEDGHGGVAYESMIVTSELIKSCNSGKFIPVVRSPSRKVPANLSSKLWVDLVDDSPDEFQRLVRTIHGLPAAGRPPIVPFRPSQDLQNKRTSAPSRGQLKELLAHEPRQVFLEAANAASAKDSVALRNLRLMSQKYIRDELPKWRNTAVLEPVRTPEHLAEFVMSCYRIFNPMIACAIAGVQSNQSEYCKQSAVVEEIVNQANWNGTGLIEVTEVLEAVAFVYQAIHGATCVMAGRFDLVTSSVVTPMSLWRHRSDEIKFWEHPGIIGWPNSLGRNATICWAFLKSLFQRIDWLEDLFVTVENFVESLIGYYVFLNLLEYGHVLNISGGTLIKSSANMQMRLSVPLAFCKESRETLESAARRLLVNRTEIRAAYEVVRTVSEEDGASWPVWSAICLKWVAEIKPFACTVDDVGFLRVGPKIFNLTKYEMSR
jgi:hypothetical protein